MSAEALIETIHLTKIYGDGAGVRALDDVTLTVNRGEMVAVMGPSGSGKSTLLNLIGALDRPTEGQVLVNGQDLAQVRDLDAFRARTVGFVFQLHNLLPTLTALENVEVPMLGQPIPARERRQRARELLERVGLGHRLHHLPSQLSGGERQRVAVARALANHPPLILADEPTGSLDSQSGAEIMTLLQHLNREQGVTIVVVTHDPRVARSTQRILTMRDGRIVDDHRVRDPLVEDLRDLARSQLGQLLLRGQAEQLSRLGVDVDGHWEESARALRELLRRAM
ncbi:MAG: ABC transporter ATP-binding protein [Anaerolineae bacterium]|nr:ABC transporter ATP-binding protein [Anaerolineae bacterium]MDW8100184.1 ABC transporter ATP-binding protein [Anaerolineae bacterium]